MREDKWRKTEVESEEKDGGRKRKQKIRRGR